MPPSLIIFSNLIYPVKERGLYDDDDDYDASPEQLLAVLQQCRGTYAPRKQYKNAVTKIALQSL